MLQRMSDQHKISFLEKNKPLDNLEKQEAKQDKITEEEIEVQKARKLNNKDNGLMTSSYICSAITGVITDEGGPSKYIKSETSNTLWNSDKTAKLTKDNKEQTIEEKKSVATNKREAEQKRMDDLVEELKTTELSKTSNITTAGYLKGSNYKLPNNNMSIFDTQDFQRLAEKTEGEKLTENVQEKKNQKDESWKGDKKAVSSLDLIKGYFNKLLG